MSHTRLTRRQFLQATAGAAGLLLTGARRSARRVAGTATPSPLYRVDSCPVPTWLPADDPAADPTAHHAGVDALVDLMGRAGLRFYRSPTRRVDSGPDGIIGANNVVLVKVNAQWERRGMTNTDVVRGLIRRVLDHPDGFTGEVVIVEQAQRGDYLANPWNNNDDMPDHTQSHADVAALYAGAGHRVSIYQWYTIMYTVVGEYHAGNNTDGYVCLSGTDSRGYPLKFPLNYPKFTTAFGTRISLKLGVWDGSQYDNGRLKLINVPVLKRHSMWGYTGAVKHYIGVMSRFANNGGDDWSWHDNCAAAWNGMPAGLLGRLIALLRPADLHLMDAIYVQLPDHFGYDWSDASHQNSLVASLDPVALDYYCGKHILYPLNSDWASHPDNDNDFRHYMLAARDRLVEYGYDVHFDEGGYRLVQADAAAVLGDLDGSGWVDGADISDMTGQWRAAPNVLHDLNGDGRVDVVDTAELARRWGQRIGE
jgi:uncharacterized protein (DUF362 family)